MKNTLQTAIKEADRLPSLFRSLQYSSQRKAFLQRARRAHKRLLNEPGDCAGDENLLAALAVAEAEIGRGPGWIPEVQRIACILVRLMDNPSDLPALQPLR